MQVLEAFVQSNIGKDRPILKAIVINKPIVTVGLSPHQIFRQNAISFSLVYSRRTKKEGLQHTGVAHNKNGGQKILFSTRHCVLKLGCNTIRLVGSNVHTQMSQAMWDSDLERDEVVGGDGACLYARQHS